MGRNWFTVDCRYVCTPVHQADHIYIILIYLYVTQFNKSQLPWTNTQIHISIDFIQLFLNFDRGFSHHLVASYHPHPLLMFIVACVSSYSHLKATCLKWQILQFGQVSIKQLHTVTTELLTKCMQTSVMHPRDTILQRYYAINCCAWKLAFHISIDICIAIYILVRWQ